MILLDPSRRTSGDTVEDEFEAGGIDRITPLLEGVDGPERAHIRFDLAVTSVLLDAGTGTAWRWREPGTGIELARSESLGVGSFTRTLAPQTCRAMSRMCG